MRKQVEFFLLTTCIGGGCNMEPYDTENELLTAASNADDAGAWNVPVRVVRRKVSVDSWIRPTGVSRDNFNDTPTLPGDFGE